LQLHLPVSGNHADILETALEESGAVSVTLTDGADEPLFEPPPGATPLWRETIVSALFESTRDPQELISCLRQKTGFALTEFKVELLADRKWERVWMDDFKPMKFGQRLWVVPSNCEAPYAEAINLKLDPGLAFGTGTHETTALCLEWLDETNLDGKSVLDFGCGSGILAIASLLCGATTAIGTDIDPQAIVASIQNAERNGVADRLSLFLPDDLPASDVDVVLANILAAPLITLANTLAAHCKPGGDLVLSGILVEQADEVLRAFTPWFVMEPPVSRGDWARLAGKRLAS
jgi:ribosomal protein L11 methyltransferase